MHLEQEQGTSRKAYSIALLSRRLLDPVAVTASFLGGADAVLCSRQLPYE